MRCLKMFMVGIGSWLILCPVAITRAQGEAGSETSGVGTTQASGGGEGTAMPAMPARQQPYKVRHADGTSEEGVYTAFHNYVLAPGWAKPRRYLGSSNVMGGGYSYLAIRSGQSKRPQKGEGNTSGSSAQSIPAGTIVIAALVLAKTEKDSHSQVIVGQLQPPNGMGGMDGGMSGSGMGGMGMPGMGMEGGMMGGGGGMMGGGMGSMGDMMGGGMGMSDMGPGEVAIVPLEESRILAGGRSAGEPQLTVAQLKNLAELVRVDCWIEEELSTLRSVRQDAEKFKSSESQLKELLSKEYELQLSKQREDIERLNEKLKALQGELTRRASAQDRVVEVQLGQLILEAQGLIGER